MAKRSWKFRSRVTIRSRRDRKSKDPAVELDLGFSRLAERKSLSPPPPPPPARAESSRSRARLSSAFPARCFRPILSRPIAKLIARERSSLSSSRSLLARVGACWRVLVLWFGELGGWGVEEVRERPPRHDGRAQVTEKQSAIVRRRVKARLMPGAVYRPVVASERERRRRDALLSSERRRHPRQLDLPPPPTGPSGPLALSARSTVRIVADHGIADVSLSRVRLCGRSSRVRGTWSC
jgi:hypothetical protein